MSQYDNTNRGVLFKNDRKEKDTQPDYTGSLNVDGVEFFLDAWLKDSQSGRRFMSVSVKRKEKQPEAPAPRQAAPKPQRQQPKSNTGFDDMDDDVPFASSCESFDMATLDKRRMKRYRGV